MKYYNYIISLFYTINNLILKAGNVLSANFKLKQIFFLLVYNFRIGRHSSPSWLILCFLLLSYSWFISTSFTICSLYVYLGQPLVLFPLAVPSMLSWANPPCLRICPNTSHLSFLCALYIFLFPCTLFSTSSLMISSL